MFHDAPATDIASAFEQIVRSCPDAIVVANGDRIIYANPAAVALFRAPNEAAVLGRPLSLPDRRSHQQMRTLDGETIDVEVSATPIEFQGKKVRAAVLRDVTDADQERTNLERMLDQAQRVGGLGRLVATVAHEFNNVLMAIQPYAEIIGRRRGDAEAIAKSVNAIVHAIGRGKRITGEILRFTRPSDPVLTRVNLREWLPRIAQEVCNLEMRGIEIVVKPPADDVWLKADVRQIEQLVWNLVVNARDAMPDGGCLTLATGDCDQCSYRCEIRTPEGLDGFACITVTDTGCGIDDEHLRRIFEPLYTTKRNGTGLGLAIVQQIATSHGGYIFASSVAGKGSTFFCILRKEAQRAEEIA